MKKAIIILQQQYAHKAVSCLSRQGVLHVMHEVAPKAEKIDLLEENHAAVSGALGVLNNYAQASPAKQSQLPEGKTQEICLEIIAQDKLILKLQEERKALSNKISDLEKWGDFNPAKIGELSQQGLYFKLYQVPQKQIHDFPEVAVVKQIFSSGGFCYCAVVSASQISVDFKEIPLPQESLSSLLERVKQNQVQAESLVNRIRQDLCFLSALEAAKDSLEKEIEFQKVIFGMGKTSTLVYLTGFIPYDKEKMLLAFAREQKWGIIIKDPSQEDDAPVLLRHSKIVNLIKPVFKLLEIVPGYRELDVSPVFLLFLSLFFGMIIGDAGYGAVYFLLTLFAQRKLGKKAKDKTVFFLFYLFSSCAIIWGLLTGTVFGQAWYVEKGFKALVPALNEAKFLMAFCFLLGAVQLSIAHLWQAIAKAPSLKALADIGFICLLWAGFFLAKMFILGDNFPGFGAWFIWSGALLIVFFSSPQKNILKGLAEGLGALALGAMGNFGDVVSYIRLFAVGLAAVAVADSVNMLAQGVGNNFIAQAAILFAGHTINIVLGPVSVLVHGVRLNILEFSLLHGNVTWSGTAYKPLKS
ncbi:MAG: hypothetical protein MUF05_04450 [Candidatus Omnitrophica bacterium]|nr:hypothetical protein [Candidatus Omnitrophota bacterium]